MGSLLAPDEIERLFAVIGVLATYAAVVWLALQMIRIAQLRQDREEIRARLRVAMAEVPGERMDRDGAA